jgi:hypothetical protein
MEALTKAVLEDLLSPEELRMHKEVATHGRKAQYVHSKEEAEQQASDEDGLQVSWKYFLLPSQYLFGLVSNDFISSFLLVPVLLHREDKDGRHLRCLLPCNPRILPVSGRKFHVLCWFSESC